MNQELIDQLRQWNSQQEHEQIIRAIEALPQEGWDSHLIWLLARAYSNLAQGNEHPEHQQRALDLLQSAPEPENPDWNGLMGFVLYWLDREEEAIPHLEQALEQLPEEADTLDQREACQYTLENCQAAVRKGELMASLKKNPLDEDAARELLILGLHGSLYTRDIVEDGCIYCPDWQLTITPVIDELHQENVSIYFYLSSPKWDDVLFECSAAVGQDVTQAMGMASGSFLFSFMQGIAKMEQAEPDREIDTVFAGHTHRWGAYFSDVVGMGQSPKIEGPHIYWEALQDGILKRLGNQKLCYVKVYAAKIGEEVIGECRIDDVKSEELSAVVAELAAQWEVQNFASHKLFFFLKQQEDTVLPNPYSGLEGRRLLREKVKIAAELFSAADTEEAYNNLPEALEQALGDPVLAGECYVFLPEICAEHAFSEILYSEAMDICLPGQPKVTCYKNQLAEYWPLQNALFSLFNSGVFGEKTNQIYSDLVGVSSIAHLISQVREKEPEHSLEGVRISNLIYNMGEEFEIR